MAERIGSKQKDGKPETAAAPSSQSAPALSGRDYVALYRLSTREDDTLALPGETCERVPAASLPGLIMNDKIRLANPPKPAAVVDNAPASPDDSAAGQE